MRRLARLALGLLVLATASPARAAVPELWNGVQQALAAENQELLEERLDQLRDEAKSVGVERMTPYAAALAGWAARHPGPLGEQARAAAEELDPRLPEPVLLSARWRWAEGARLRAAGDYLGGLVRLAGFERTRRALAVSTGLWLLASFVVASLVTMVVVVLQCLRRIVADAVRVGRSMLGPANAIVFAIVIVALPLFGGLGPVWWLVYLFAMTWGYLRTEGRVVAISTTLLLGFAVSLAAVLQSTMLRPVPISERVAGMLDDRRLDLAALRELADAEETFRGIAGGHLILGELFRMHGEDGRARLQFQAAATASPGDPRPSVFLGNLAMEDSDVARAVALFTAATTVDPGYALAYHNLSSAYDQSRRFQEGDEARRRARELAGGSTDELGVGGGESRLRYPRLDARDVERFVAALSPEQRMELGLMSTSSRPMAQLLRRESLVFWLPGLLGCVVLMLRLRWLPPSRSCAKCGNVYRMPSGGGEALKYCSQCVSVFLKRDLVSIEQQTQKMRQIRRWELREMLRRRIGTVLAPGSVAVLEGRSTLGMATAVAAWVLLLGALVWAPRLLSAAEPSGTALPIQVVMLALWVAIWGWSLASTWNRR